MWPSKKLRDVAGEADGWLVEHGRPARGVVIHVEPAGATLTIAGELHRVCRLTVEVVATGDGRPYVVSVRQRIPAAVLTALTGREVAVRVDPHDRDHAAIVLDAP